MLVVFLHRVVLIALAAATCVLLAGEFGSWPAMGLWSAISSCGCLLGALLLRTSSLGSITWKNWVACNLLPWGYRMNRGRLWPIVLASWIAWVSIGAAVLTSTAAGPEPTTGAEDWGPFEATLLFAAWVVDGGAFLHVLGTLVQQFVPGWNGGKSLLKVLIFLLAILGLSIGLFLNGQPFAALLVAGGPLAILGVVYGLFLAAVLIFGRNARWN